jgi:hypothetical protein
MVMSFFWLRKTSVNIRQALIIILAQGDIRGKQIDWPTPADLGEVAHCFALEYRLLNREGDHP